MKAVVSLFLLIGSIALACPTGDGAKMSKHDIDHMKKSLKKMKPAGVNDKREVAGALRFQPLPSATSVLPWGGINRDRWKPEAILANAVSAELNEAWTQDDVVDVLVSTPVRMIYGGKNERVYGDGQTNATLTFGTGWIARDPQLLATLTRFRDGRRTVKFRFSGALNFPQPKISLTSFVRRAGPPLRRDETLDLTRKPEGWFATWTVPNEVTFGDIERSWITWVRPNGWDSSFPIDFRSPTYTIPELMTAVGPLARTANRSVLDPMGIRDIAMRSRGLPKLALMNAKFGPEWFKNDQGQVQIHNAKIHADFPKDGPRTAVGGGDTWFVEKGKNSFFKNLYTCFDARDPIAEKNESVPSGGGWHEIGDAAETILNSLESAPIPVGFAAGMPNEVPVDGTKFAYGLTDVSTVRMLWPGEAATTPAGDQTWLEDEPFRKFQRKEITDWEAANALRGKEKSGRGRNYHWFFFPYAVPVCTQEWVHNCRPLINNRIGLACP